MDEKIKTLTESLGLDEKASEALLEGLQDIIESKATELAAERIDEMRTALEEERAELENELKEEFERRYNERLNEMVSAIEETLQIAFNEWAEKHSEEIRDRAIVEAADAVLRNSKEFILRLNNRVDEDIYNALKSELKELKGLYRTVVLESKAKDKELLEYKKALHILKASEGLTEAKKQKLIEMAELVDADDFETFVENVDRIKATVLEEASEDATEEEGGEALHESHEAEDKETESNVVTHGSWMAFLG